MARLLIYPKQQRYNVRYEKNWIFIEANQFFYYFYLSFHNQRGAPLRPAAAHVETENTGQADAEGSLTERNTENVKLLRGLRRTALLVLPDSKMRLAKKEMMNINNRKRHLFRKAYADMYIKEEKYLQKEDCFPAPHYW